MKDSRCRERENITKILLLTDALCGPDSRRAKDVNAVLGIDATFGPPPLQDPFAWGADIVMHSGTKYFAGHSDALVGSVSVRSKAEWNRLWHNRTYTGSNIGSLDAWLLLRSLRTLQVRVTKQSETATQLAQWLAALARAEPATDLDGPGGVVQQVWHTSLQEDRAELLGEGKQMTAGPATFAILLKNEVYATHLPHHLECFIASHLLFHLSFWRSDDRADAVVRNPLPRTAGNVSWRRRIPHRATPRLGPRRRPAIG